MIQRGDIVARIAPNGKTVAISRPEIVNQWGLWWAVSIMVTGSFVTLAAKPELFTGLLKVFKKTPADSKQVDVLADIELPLMWSYLGVPLFSGLAVFATHSFFDVSWTLALASLPLVLVLAVICTNAMALTSWTPVSAMAKITQFSMGAIDRTNPASNLIPAGVTAEVASNAANLLSDIKPGYMLGAKPRQQALGHLIGIFSGALACIPLYYLLFLPADANGLRSTETILSEQFPMPNAMQWKGVAELIAKGITSLPSSALIAMVVAAIAAILIELGAKWSKGKLPLSAVSIGLGVVLPPESCIAMWLGAALFWWMSRRHETPKAQVTNSG